MNPTARQRAALRLATLGSEDRQWVMDRLSSSERSLIEPLLAALPKCAPGALAAVIDELDVATVRPPAEPDSTLAPLTKSSRPIERALARDLGPVLDELPIGCASLMVERLPPRCRHVLRAASGDLETSPATGVTPAFVDLLLEVVEERLGGPSTDFESVLTADALARPAAGIAA